MRTARSADGEASWEVVAFVREAPAVIGPFVRAHLALGAARVRAFQDGPLDPACVGAAPQAAWAACDDAFWAGLGRNRPCSVEARQCAAYDHAFATCEADWLLVVDADEVVTPGFGAWLARVPPGVASVQLPTAEAAWRTGSDAERAWSADLFRLPGAAPGLLERLYGPLAGLFQGGVLGHAEGKQLVRRGATVAWVGLHVSGRPGGGVLTVRAGDAVPARPAPRLLHHDAMSRGRWAAKWRARASGAVIATEMSPVRRRQMAAFARADAAGATDALFAALYRLDGWQRAVLAEAGLLYRPASGQEPHSVSENAKIAAAVSAVVSTSQ